VVTRQKLAYWFFWVVFVALIPICIEASLQRWSMGVDWTHTLWPLLTPFAVLKLIGFIKRYHLDERAWPSDPPPGTERPSMRF